MCLKTCEESINKMNATEKSGNSNRNKKVGSYWGENGWELADSAVVAC